MDEKPLVSVIMPVYNSASYLEQSVTSLFSQTYPHFEIICIDDGSSDGSLALLEKFQKQDSRLTQIIKQKNEGPGRARNKGIEAAQGEYLTFLDSDDWVKPELLEKAVAKALEVDAEVVIWDMWNYQHEYQRKQHPFHGTLSFWNFDEGQTPFFNWQDNPQQIFTSFHNWPWNKLYKTDLIMRDNIRFSDHRTTEDLQFTGLAYLGAKRMACIHEKLTYYRIGRSDSAMALRDQRYTDFIDAFVSFKAVLEQRGLYEQVKQSYVNWALSGALYNLVSYSDYDEYLARYDRLKSHDFEAMDIRDYGKEYFYDELLYDDYRAVMELTPDRFLFRKAKQNEEDYLRTLTERDFLQQDYDAVCANLAQGSLPRRAARAVYHFPDRFKQSSSQDAREDK